MFKERRGQRQYKTSGATTIACACNLDYQLAFDKTISYQVMLLLITATFYDVLVLQAAARVQ